MTSSARSGTKGKLCLRKDNSKEADRGGDTKKCRPRPSAGGEGGCSVFWGGGESRAEASAAKRKLNCRKKSPLVHKKEGGGKKVPQFDEGEKAASSRDSMCIRGVLQRNGDLFLFFFYMRGEGNSPFLVKEGKRASTIMSLTKGREGKNFSFAKVQFHSSSKKGRRHVYKSLGEKSTRRGGKEPFRKKEKGAWPSLTVKGERSVP